MQPIFDVSASGGTDGYKRGLVDVGAPLDQDSAFRVVLMDQDIDGTRPSVNTRSYGVSPSIAFGIGSPTQIGLSWLTQHNNDHVDYGFPMFQFKNDPILEPLQAPFGRTYQYTNAVVRTDVNIFNISLLHTFSPDIVFRSNTQYGIYNVHQNTAPLNTVFEALDANGNYQQVQPSAILAPPTTPLDQLEIAPQQKQRTERDSSLFNQTDLLFKFATGPMRHELIVGGEFGRDEYDQLFFNNYNFNLNNGTSLGANLAGVINLGSTNTQPFPSGANVYQVPGNVTDIGADTVAFYFNDTVSFDACWKLVAGLRWDDFDASQTYSVYNYPESHHHQPQSRRYRNGPGSQRRSADTAGDYLITVPASGRCIQPARGTDLATHRLAELLHFLQYRLQSAGDRRERDHRPTADLAGADPGLRARRGSEA